MNERAQAAGPHSTYLLLQHVFGVVVQLATALFDVLLELLDPRLLASQVLVVVRLLLNQSLDRLGRDAELGWCRHCAWICVSGQGKVITAYVKKDQERVLYE